VSLLVVFATPASAVPKTGSWAIDVVQPGDTLSAIANRHGTTWQNAGGHDYAAIGKYADRVFVMAYDWPIPPFTGPGPVAPHAQVKATMSYASTVISPKKLYLGIPMYGYDWNVSTGKGRALSQQKALKQAIDRRATIRFDPHSRTPYYRYTANGERHEVWFEDARSLASKFALVKRHKWAGVRRGEVQAK